MSRLDNLSISSALNDMSISNNKNEYNIAKYMSRYFPRPDEFLEMMIVHRFLMSGHIANLFRLSSSGSDVTYIYYCALPSRYGNIKTIIIDHFIRIQNATYDPTGYFIVGKHRIMLIDYTRQSDISICERILVHQSLLQSDAVIMTGLGSHLISVSGIRNRQSSPEFAVDANIWYSSLFIPYANSSNKYVFGIKGISRYDPLLTYINNN